MKFGVREICDVVLKTKEKQTIGNQVFEKNEPVLYFDTLKTSSMEGAATTVYAQGGKGNARLMAWEGERTVTFTMEDALISPMGFSILSGAGLINAASENKVQVHVSEITQEVTIGGDTVTITTGKTVSTNEKAKIYVMGMENGEIVTEPFIATGTGNTITVKAGDHYTVPDLAKLKSNSAVMIDYYTEKESNTTQIEITPDKFGGTYYLEASTLFRAKSGQDYPAEFVIPSCKIQSNFNFAMASTGDPSTFTFTMDAFPDYTKFDPTKKVLAAIQILDKPV